MSRIVTPGAARARGHAMTTILAGIACADCKTEPPRHGMGTRDGLPGWRFEKRRTAVGFTIERRCPGCWEARDASPAVESAAGL
jgi:hypothetical protein